MKNIWAGFWRLKLNKCFLIFIFVFNCKPYFFRTENKISSSEKFNMVSVGMDVLEINGKPASTYPSDDNTFSLGTGEYSVKVTMSKHKNKLKAGTFIQREFISDLSEVKTLSFTSKKDETIYLCPNIDFHLGWWRPISMTPLYFKSTKYQKYPDECFGYDGYLTDRYNPDIGTIFRFKKGESKIPINKEKEIVEIYRCAKEKAALKGACLTSILSFSDEGANNGMERSKEIKKILIKNNLDVKDISIESGKDESGITNCFSYFRYDDKRECFKTPEIKCLSGDCKNSVSTFVDDKIREYTGEFNDGFAHGKGIRLSKCGSAKVEENGIFEEGWLVKGFREKKENYNLGKEEGDFFGKRFMNGISYKKNLENEFIEFALVKNGEEIISIHDDKDGGDYNYKWIRKQNKEKFEVIYITRDGKNWKFIANENKNENESYRHFSCTMVTEAYKLCSENKKFFPPSECKNFSKVVDTVCKTQDLSSEDFSNIKLPKNKSKRSIGLWEFK